MTQMGINGFGRIGRLVFRAAMENQSVACLQMKLGSILDMLLRVEVRPWTNAAMRRLRWLQSMIRSWTLTT